MTKSNAARKVEQDYDPVNLDQAWVNSLPEYRGPDTVHALQIQHVEKYNQSGAPRDKTGQKTIVHQSLASAPAGSTSAIPATERPQPEDYGQHGAARITPSDKSYPAFEVDEKYLLESRPHTGGYYIVYSNGAEGFEAPEIFTQKYTLVPKPEEVKAREELAEKVAKQNDEQAAEQEQEKADTTRLAAVVQKAVSKPVAKTKPAQKAKPLAKAKGRKK